MTQLLLESYVMPAARLGPPSPFPPLVHPDKGGIPMPCAENIPPSDQKYIGYGRTNSTLPYSLQDDYDRNPLPRQFKAAVLENEILRVTFLPELGGRLWSLIHKPTQRELLYVNPVFQPANLAIRNAWFSGGVEWNASLIGHSPFTCEPVFTATFRDLDDTPVLRFYEWERRRGLFFQIDFRLPSGSPVLLATPRLVNPTGAEIPTYWYSNIAVPETPGLRVLAPCSWATTITPDGKLDRLEAPRRAGVDFSYPENARAAADYFFRIPDARRAWIAAVDRDGRGLFQTSTARQLGRKLFVWGMQPGGRRWQEFLTDAASLPYVEIQAGLGRTQVECQPLPAGADWSWTEAYGLLEADAAQAHADNWESAIGHVDERLNALLSPESLESLHDKYRGQVDRVPDALIQAGSGWGALENLRRSHGGLPSISGPGAPFPSSTLGELQNPWRELLENGSFPVLRAEVGFYGWMIQPEWETLLANAIAASDRADHWNGRLQLGLMRYAAGDFSAARLEWERSIKHQPTAWALRNLAVLAGQQNRPDERVTLILRACGMLPSHRVLATEACQALLDVGRASEALALLDSLPNELRQLGRLRMLRGYALLQLDRLEEVKNILDDENLIVVDLREGERAMSELWFAYHGRRMLAETGREPERTVVRLSRPPPARIDFRMSSDPAP